MRPFQDEHGDRSSLGAIGASGLVGGLQRNIVQLVLCGDGSIRRQVAAADEHDGQAVRVSLLPFGHIGQQRITGAASRLGENQQKRFTGLAQGVEGNHGAVEGRQSKGRRGSVDGKAGLRRRRMHAEFLFHGFEAQQEPAVLPQQVQERPDRQRRQRRECNRERQHGGLETVQTG